MSAIKSCTFLVATLFFVCPSLARAEAAPTEPSPSAATNEAEAHGGDGRVVNEHAFITPQFAQSAFLNTSFRFAQGFGIASFSAPSPTTGGRTDGKLFLYGQQLLAQVGIANRFAVDLRGQGVAAVGGDLDTIVGIGAIAQLNVGATPKVRIVTLENVGLQLTVGAGISYDRNITVKPAALIGKATGELSGAEAQLVQQSQALNVSPTLMVAEGIGPLGLQASIAPRIAAAGEASSGFDAGFHAAFSFYNLTRNVPLAITGDLGLSHDSNTQVQVGGGLYYAGRRDFELGVATSLRTGDVSLVQGQMVMQYYF